MISNDFVEWLPMCIKRTGAEGYEEKLKETLEKTFRSIDIEALHPTEENIQRARVIINLDIIKGRVEDLFEVLRGEA